MKARHIASAAMAGALLSLSGTLYFFGWSAFDANLIGPDRTARVDLGDVPPIDPGLRNTVKDLYERLGEIARPRAHRAGEVNFRMLGFRQEAAQRGRAAMVLSSEERFDDHVVSMAYVTDRQRFAVIDGKLYSEGDRIEGSGGHVRTITPDKVLIADREVRQWLEVKNRQAKAKPEAEEDQREALAEAAPANDPELPDTPARGVLEAVQALKSVSEKLRQLQGESPLGTSR